MTDELAAVLASAIRAERSRLGWSQTALGERLHWSQTKVAQVEAGIRRVYVHELPAICSVLGVPLSRLLMDADPADLAALGL